MISIIPCVKIPDYQEKNTIYVPNIENDSMAKKYNRGIEIALKKYPNEQIFCLRHDDTAFRQRIDIIEYKLNKQFLDKDIGVAGVIGCLALYPQMVWWVDRGNNGLGRIVQGYRDTVGYDEKKKPIFVGPWHEKIMVDKIEINDCMATCDGCCLFFPRRSFEAGLRFDESLPDYHFYDVDICLQCLERGWKVGLTDALIYHQSMGLMPDNFGELAKIVKAKWDKRIDNWPISRLTKFKKDIKDENN